jgi:hypothetical protein
MSRATAPAEASIASVEKLRLAVRVRSAARETWSAADEFSAVRASVSCGA